MKPDVHLNLRVRGLKPSATIAINEHSNALAAEGRRVFKLGLGQSPFPVPEPVVEELRRYAGEKDYLPVRGLAALRQAIAEHHHRTFAIECEADDVLIGPGSKELMFLLQLVYYGDLVVPSPAWVSYAPQARIIGRNVRWLPTSSADNWCLRAAQLDAHCREDPDRPRILILNYPSNPTAATYSASELEELADVARRYRIVVLSDEIYAKLHHGGEHASIVPYYPEGTIFSGGLSKWCGAGGWRLGAFVFPAGLRWLLDAMAAVASETYTSTSAPIQYAAVRAFQGGEEIDRYLADSRRILKALGRRLAADLAEVGASVEAPQGGFYLFPDLTPLRESIAARGIGTSEELCRRLLEETGVAILPGKDFGRPAEEMTVRLAYVNFDGARALEAVGQLAPEEEVGDELLKAHCGESLEGVARLCEWLRASG